ncbi:MAG: hypothetical protein MZV64_71865 [Ignavibacteriales bacterium]|nr:hypothetical protein [Ignavibacteriales bacterium]
MNVATVVKFWDFLVETLKHTPGQITDHCSLETRRSNNSLAAPSSLKFQVIAFGEIGKALQNSRCGDIVLVEQDDVSFLSQGARRSWRK